MQPQLHKEEQGGKNKSSARQIMERKRVACHPFI